MKRRLNLLLTTTTVLLLLLTGTACVSIEKVVETGDYDRAIAMAHRHLAGKKNKKTKYVRALEESFDRANQRDLAQADRLKSSGEEADWGRINDLYRRIKQRQEFIAPLLPLIDKEGVKANFRFVKVDGMERESRERAAAYHYGEGLELLSLARRGDKSAGRAAHREFEQVLHYRRDYRDTEQLLREAEELGVVYVIVEVRNRSGAILPAGFETELLRIRTHEMNSRWRQFDLQPRPGLTYDYRAEFSIVDLEVSPEQVSNRTYVDSREIEDGWEYVLDERGNVAKDTLGNDIKQARIVTVKAQVYEVLQEKYARVSGRMDLYNLQNRNLVDSRDLTAEARFENYAATFSGDKRALSDESRQRIGNRPGPFPTNEELLLQAAGQLKPRLEERLAESSRLI